MAARARAGARAREGAEVWRDRVERWKQSGKTVREFASREGIRPERLAWWKWHLQRREASLEANSSVPALVPVQVRGAEPESAASGIELVLASGRVVVRVGPEFDERTLCRVVDVLGGAS